MAFVWRNDGGRSSEWTWPVAAFWLMYIAGCAAIVAYEAARRSI